MQLCSNKIGLVYAFVSVIVGCDWKLGKQQNLARETAVVLGDITQEVKVPGVLTPKSRLVVYPTFDGYIRKIFVNIGQQVKAGDPLVQVSSSPSPTDVAYPQRAQFSGRVVDIMRREGEWVEKLKDHPIMIVDDTSVFTVECAVPELDISKYKVGLNAVVSPLATPGRQYDGRVLFVSEAAKVKDANYWGQSAVEFTVKVEVLNPNDLLKSGMTATVQIIFDAVKGVPSLPHDYVDLKDGKASVLTADGSRKEVMLGISDDRLIQIKSGLAVGEKVRQIDFYTEKM